MSKRKKRIADHNIAIIDCETTGLNIDQHEIIEIAAILYNPQSDRVIREWSRKAKPRHIKTADEQSLDINGYNRSQKSYTGDIEEIISNFYNLTNGFILAGWKIRFDIDFVDKYLQEFSVNDDFYNRRGLEISSMAYMALHKKNIKSLSLFEVCKYFGISNKGEHSALTDCRRTLEVFRCLTKKTQI